MTTSGKIRVLLALLCASLLFTALIVQNTYTPLNSLQRSGKVLEDNLHQKEEYVNAVVNNKTRFDQLKTLPDSQARALNFIQDLTADKGIWAITLVKDSLTFWSGIKVIPQNFGAIRSGNSFIKEANGYYEVIRKNDGDFSAIFFIPVKKNYAFQNQYLQNTFSADLLSQDNVAIADTSDKPVYEIYSSNKVYLFSVKLKPGQVDRRFFYYEMACWAMALLSLCILVQSICNYILNKGYPMLSAFFMAAFMVLSRVLTLYYNWPDLSYRLKIFSPSFYASSAAFPSLGDLCINVLFFSWFAGYLYRLRHIIIKKQPARFVAYTIFITGITALIIISTALVNLFYGLVVNSKINFDVNNILNLSVFSMIGVLMLCFSFLIFYLLIETFLTITVKLAIPVFHRVFIFIIIIALSSSLAALYQEFTVFYLLWAILVLIRGYAYEYHDGRMNAASFSAIIVTCALISSIKLNYFESAKEKDIRKTLIQKLETPDDVKADLLFNKIEKQIRADSSIIGFFNDTLQNNDFLKNRFQQLYFDGYLSKYEFKVHVFNSEDLPLASEKKYSLGVFKDMVLYSSFKVSDYFYRENESFGFQNYFAILPVVKNSKNLGTIVVELRSKPLILSGTFPELLIDGQVQLEDEFKDYSYAFYKDDKLLSQSGTYVYNLTNNVFKGELKKYISVVDHNSGPQWYRRFSAYEHLIYKPTKRNLIVVSKESNLLVYGITSITFFFVIMLAFSAVLILARWSWLRIKILNISGDHLKWKIRINFDRILYRTRIQFSMVVAVVGTLILVGFITFLSISNQYNVQQDKMIRDKITHIVATFESGSIDKYLNTIDEAAQVEFNEFANANSTDLILYDNKGLPLITTQPKIYEYGLQAKRMNARAFIQLNKLQKSEYVNNEIIGGLSYKAAYAVLRNLKGETLAYIQVPYFSNEADYKERIGSLINVMINVYALVFIAIGFFAVIIARQITAPLNFIQESLSKTIYGKKNEPIKWKRDDEIGALVAEYNKMIAALENSASRLAQSERESAWREMAKQVAHEIKNPLTPLKLGLQLLDKSWKDKDPKFDQKFERFSKSFVEQIESLSSIASEFSAFAKMPDTRIELINIFDMLGQAVTIFKQMDNVKISYHAPETPFYINADRDQLLRCFNNLLKNAIEATPADRFGLIEINYLVTNKNILLTIKDNGNGIPEHMREKIFEPNFTTKSSGTGLGLAFVKNSIENAGGKVWFETILGTGTTFYFSLPSA